MNRDYIEIGVVPYEEDCQQVGMPGYDPVRAKLEARTFADQLTRMFPEGDFRVASCPHDFGNYFEVRGYYESDTPSEEAAYKAEANAPARWDRESKEALGLGYST